jgi:hypothetical protein
MESILDKANEHEQPACRCRGDHLSAFSSHPAMVTPSVLYPYVFNPRLNFSIACDWRNHELGDFVPGRVGVS